MNLVQTIRSTRDRVIHIILDDEEIIISKLGEYCNKKWYSWTSWGPTEGEQPSYFSSAVTEDEVINRIGLITDGEELAAEYQLGIDIFFGKHIEVYAR